MDVYFHNMLGEALECPSMYNTCSKDLKDLAGSCQKGPNSSKSREINGGWESLFSGGDVS